MRKRPQEYFNLFLQEKWFVTYKGPNLCVFHSLGAYPCELRVLGPGSQLDVQQASEEGVSSRCEEMTSRSSTGCAGLLEIHQKCHGNAGRACFLEDYSTGNMKFLARSKVTYLHRTVRYFLIC
jgi:hypothetical protein